MRSFVSISCAVISTPADEVEALHLDLAADVPEGVPAGAAAHQPALDIEQTGFVVSRPPLRHHQRPRALGHREVPRADPGSLATSMRSTSTRVATFQ